MHILLISNYPPPYEGGIQFVLGQIYDRCTALGHQVTILASDTGIPKNLTRSLVGVPASNWLEQHSIPFPIFDPLRLTRELSRLLPAVDAVHVHGALYMSSVFGAIMAQRRGIPVVLTEHVGMIDYHSPLLNNLQKLAFHTIGRLCCRASDVAVILNERARQEIQPLVRKRTPILKVPNGVDTALFIPAEPDEREALRKKWNFSKPTVLFVGRLVRKKRVDLVLEAARLVPEIDFVLCGKDTEQLQTSLPNVRIIGKLEQSALREIYAAADSFLLPSEGEGFPLSVQEALACGLPVIVTDDPTNREYLDESIARFVPQNGAAIAETLQALFSDPAHLSAIQIAARPFAVARFDWDQTIASYLRLYRGDHSIVSSSE